MKVYIGIDLHSNNSVVVVIDEKGQKLYEKRLKNDLTLIKAELKRFKKRCVGTVVESTFNWYWLVDGLMEEGYKTHLANPAAIDQYTGLKFSDDKSDARWLAEMLRLDILEEGYIYPKEDRPLRDLLRKRSQLKKHRTGQILSIQDMVARNSGIRISGNDVKKMKPKDLDRLLTDTLAVQAAQSNLRVYECVNKEMKALEKTILALAKDKIEFGNLLTVCGVGVILALTILLETGDINRFERPGNYASYCRCVNSKKLSNGKKKGVNNKRNGNKYLAWAFVEAANFAIRFNPKVNRYYQRKKAKTKGVVAIKAVAHKLARAVYHVLKDEVPFDVERAFA
jgi:transposase